MFSIKTVKYKVEYEGLHLLCITCGKFGHYKEGCPDKVKQQDGNSGDRQNGGSGGGVSVGSEVDGPWVVVQKLRRQRKGKERESMAGTGWGKDATRLINGEPTLVGSRFNALSDNTPELNDNIPAIINVNEGENNQEENQTQVNTYMEGNNLKAGVEKQHVKNKKGNGGAHVERLVKNSKLATRGTQSFKGKSGSSLKKGVENISDLLVENNMERMREAQLSRPNDDNGQINMEVQNSNLKGGSEQAIQGTHNGTSMLGPNGHRMIGNMQIVQPNIPRPPNVEHNTPVNVSKVQQAGYELGVEKDEFVDASENGTAGDSESDMEVVTETPPMDV
jgi:hypothetical protein